MSETNAELLKSWLTETDFAKRNEILSKLTAKGLFPDNAKEILSPENAEPFLELGIGLYPNLPDPKAKLYNKRFLEKLLRKQEFLEDKQEGIQDLFNTDTNPEQDLLQLLESDASACGAYGEDQSEAPTMTPFELSPTQRFIGRFLSPQTPYNSALLYHGVGVGKTCSGITVAERFLEMFPRKQVFIVAPPTIQAGWLREIFNLRKLEIGKKPDIRNVYNGCTGNTYLRLSGTEFERDPDVIRRKVAAIIKSRYKIMGYLQFYNYVTKYLARSISKGLSKQEYAFEEHKYLSSKFSGGLLIIDEAHNLRDTESEVVEPKANAPPPAKSKPVVLPPSPPEEKKEDEGESEGEDEDEKDDPFEDAAPAVQPPPPTVAQPPPPAVAQPLPNEEEEEELNLTLSGGANANNEDELELEVFGKDEDEEDEDEGEQEEFAGEDKDTPATPEDKKDILKGKKVTPLLRKILQESKGMKFLMLTATPMYNDYREIIDLLNLLLLNDKRATIRATDIFKEDGSFADGPPSGRELLGRIATSYVSFMRGENPLAFPIRLSPDVEPSQSIFEWPKQQPNGSPVPQAQRDQVLFLPYVACPLDETVVDQFQTYCSQVLQTEGFTIPVVDKLIMAGNFLYPVDTETLSGRVGKKGFDSCFTRLTKPVRFQPKEAIGGEWMLSEYEGISPLLDCSSKAHFVVERLKTTKGVAFLYSRFVETGALTLALILEANGYTCASRKSPLLKLDEALDDKGRQCALCPLREKEHVPHDVEPKGFQPAYYVLLTGDKDYSPNNKAAIELATDPENVDGRKVKLILGSTIASEGIDLKFIRELFVFDSWYHLSKLEQVIGRGIRYKSHCLLPPLKRNCTVNLLVLSYGETYDKETIDMFQYRRGFMKAKQVGQVTRVLKEYAMDCNLNKELILIQGLNPIQQIDGQGTLREDIDVNDAPYTNVCDWLETCEYKCHPEIDFGTLDVDYSTYDEYAAKWREHEIKKVFRELFQRQPWYHFDDIQNKILQNIPRQAKAALLEEIVGNPSFRIRVGNQEGYILYKNGYYLFQPESLWDTNLPISLRIQDFFVKRDVYEPRVLEVEAPPKAAVNVPKPVEAAPSQGKKFWDLVVKWALTISAGKASSTTPKEINDILNSRYLSRGPKVVNEKQAAFEMIGRLAETVRENEVLRKKTAGVVLEYVWDEYLTEDEIISLAKANPSGFEIKHAASENVVQLGSISAFRYVDPKTFQLIYMCDDKQCPQSVIDEIEKADPISKLKADVTTTAKLYGFNVAKDGRIIFKSNDAVKVGDKPANGRICNTSNLTGKYEMLHAIAHIAATHSEIASDLKLSKGEAEKIHTPARICAMADLAFRLLDKTSPDGKRYFYRPISALKTNHKQKK